jgi:iron complex transport system ATP-binding protein
MIMSAPQPSEQAFHLDRVCFDYHRGHRAAAAHDGTLFKELTFSVVSGEMLGVIGPNGSGKSTLLKLLAGIVRPCAGAIQVFGRDTDALTRNEFGRLIAYVPQEFLTTFPFAVKDIVLMGRYPHRKADWLSFWGWERDADYQAAAQAMADLNLLGLADKSVHEISAGERQRMLIARALAQEAKIVLFDEPTAFLDLKYQVDICGRLHRLSRERGLTMIVVSHDLNLAGQYCDRLLLLHHGTLIGLAEPPAIMRPEVLESVYQCRVLVDHHPETGRPRVSLPGDGIGIEAHP